MLLHRNQVVVPADACVTCDACAGRHQHWPVHEPQERRKCYSVNTVDERSSTPWVTCAAVAKG